MAHLGEQAFWKGRGSGISCLQVIHFFTLGIIQKVFPVQILVPSVYAYSRASLVHLAGYGTAGTMQQDSTGLRPLVDGRKYELRLAQPCFL